MDCPSLVRISFNEPFTQTAFTNEGCQFLIHFGYEESGKLGQHVYNKKMAIFDLALSLSRVLHFAVVLGRQRLLF
jgi:hypothetical protein